MAAIHNGSEKRENGSERPAGNRRGWFRLGRRVALRTRLIAAFFLLIVTSASATIFIGNVVFGQKVVEMATSKMEVGLKVVEHTLGALSDRLRLLAVVEAERLGQGWSAERCPDFLAREPMVDFVVRVKGDTATVHHKSQSDPVPGGVCRHRVLDWGALAPGTMGALAADTRADGNARAGLMLLPGSVLGRLGYDQPPEEALLLMAGARFGDGDVVLLGASLNGRNELVTEPVDLVWPDGRRWFAATIFLRDQRVATSIGEEGLGTRVDSRVFQQVLEGGGVYVGEADVVGEDFYTAYMPLRDYRGDTVGILGIGAREQAYVDMRNRTVSLFSALIAGGMLFGFVMTYLFSAWLIRPIAELAKGMQRVALGDLSYKVRIASADELGRLAKAFNLMVRNIKERDIRLREMTEERLSAVEKQVSIGRLAAGVAHEINNPLTSVLSLSMLMLRSVDAADERREDLEVIVEETERCRRIVRSLLDFARERPPEKKEMDVGEVLRETLVLTSRYQGMDGVETELALSDEPMLVNGDAKQLQQVFTNLITNAAEATDNAGRVRIECDEDSSGGFVVVRVSDNGRGIPKADLERVFEPFFTTKGERKGTGLGLSVSHGIVRRHDGTIEMESRPGEGTTVTIFLPRVGAVPEGGAE